MEMVRITSIKRSPNTGHPSVPPQAGRDGPDRQVDAVRQAPAKCIVTRPRPRPRCPPCPARGARTPRQTILGLSRARPLAVLPRPGTPASWRFRVLKIFRGSRSSAGRPAEKPGLRVESRRPHTLRGSNQPDRASHRLNGIGRYSVSRARWGCAPDLVFERGRDPEVLTSSVLGITTMRASAGRSPARFDAASITSRSVGNVIGIRDRCRQHDVRMLIRNDSGSSLETRPLGRQVGEPDADDVAVAFVRDVKHNQARYDGRSKSG